MSGGVKEKNRIYIFSEINSDSDADRILPLRIMLKENSIEDIILIDLACISKKIKDSIKREHDFKYEIFIEELIVFETNLNVLPIVFYGDEAKFDSLIIDLCLEECAGIGWIKDPFDINDLKHLLFKMDAGGFSSSENQAD